MKKIFIFALIAMLVPLCTGAYDQALANNLKGNIMLRAEAHGEAYYVNPDDARSYYMKDGEVAYEALREFGLGISNANLEKIPIGIVERAVETDTDGDGLPDRLEDGLGTDKTMADTDGDGNNDKEEALSGSNPLGVGDLPISSSFINSLEGRILLQVEAHGEAWYINPRDGKRYYMTDGNAAYDIMRYLSLGISEENFEKLRLGYLDPCADDYFNCSDFISTSEAQATFNQCMSETWEDVHRLDSDGDGAVCEWL